MVVFDRYIKENVRNFQSDMQMMLSKLNKKIAANPNMREQELAKEMFNLFYYLFIATNGRNMHTDFPIHNGDMKVTLGIAVTEVSSNNCESDVLVEVKRPTYQLSDKDLQSLVDCMYLAKAPWGMLTNGLKLYVYELENMQEDCSLESSAKIVIDIEHFTLENLAELQAFVGKCFKEIDYVRGIKQADFVRDGIKRVEQRLEADAPYNKLFFFDEVLTTLNPCDSVNYFADNSNRKLFNDVLIQNNDYFSLGIDLVSIQSFMKLNAKDRAEFMEFQSKFRDMVVKVLSLRNAQAEPAVIDSVFLEEFGRVMGYDFKSILLSGKNVSETCNNANIAFSSDIPFKFVVYSMEVSQPEGAEFYHSIGNDGKVVIDTNIWTWFIRFGDRVDDYLRFDLGNMTFGNMYDLFLLSSKKYADTVYDSVDGVSKNMLNSMNKAIVSGYENRHEIHNCINRALQGIEGAYMLETLTPNESEIPERIYQKMEFIQKKINEMQPIINMLLEVHGLA